MSYVIHVLLLITLGSSVMGAWDPVNCKDPSVLEMCLKNLKELEKMILPTNNQTLERDCRNMKNSSNCYHEYLERCMNGTVMSVMKSKLTGVRETIHSLCDNETYKHQLEEHYSCFSSVSSKWDVCGSHFYHKASLEPAEMCKARTSFIHCSLDEAKEEKGCSSVARKQMCRISNFYANIIVPSASCNTWALCPSAAGRFLIPSSIVLLVTMLLAVRHL